MRSKLHFFVLRTKKEFSKKSRIELLTFFPLATCRCLSRMRTDMEEVMVLTRRDDNTIPVKNHKMATERPRIVLGYLSPYLAE